MNVGKNIAKLTHQNSCLFICDIQEKFRHQIFGFPHLIKVTKRLMNAAHLLDLPIYVTEQYPKGLGQTVSELEIQKYQLKPIEKTQFSMCTNEIIDKLKKDAQVKNVIIAGIETHVCVQGTALDLLELGFNVHIVADAVSSRTKFNRIHALERMKQSGAFVTTSESAILGLVGESSHSKFKEIQKLIMDNSSDTFFDT